MRIVLVGSWFMIAIGAMCARPWAGRTLGAQVSTAQTSAVRIGGGLGVQSDGALASGVRLSPIGPIAELGISHTTNSGWNVGASVSASYFLRVEQNRRTLVGPSASDDRDDPFTGLTVATLAAEVGPHRARGASWFLCAGGAFALTTPRRHDRAAPMACAGATAPITERTSLRVSFQWMVRELGRTHFQIPLIVTYATPF